MKTGLVKTCDVVIVGGGINGLALAAMLVETTSLSVVLLDGHVLNPAWSADQYHHRVSAIALSSQRIFKKLGLWEELKAKRMSPFTGIYVWDALTQTDVSFDSQEIAEPVLGYIMENVLLQTVLLKKLSQQPRFELIAPVQLNQLRETESNIEIITSTNEIYKTKLLVGADGAKSWVREQAGIQLEKTDYHQQALVTNVITSLPHQGIARQVFLPTGPLAFLPLANPQQSSIVWSLPVEQAQRYLTMQPNEFLPVLGRAFEYKLGDVESMTPLFSFPLSKQQAKSLVRSRIALIGDAAHIVHPLAGQGVNLGLLDAASLVEVVRDTVGQGRQPGSLSALRRYERWRRADNAAMQTGIHALKCLFASDQKSLQVLRSVGLKTVSQLPMIKKQFINHAIGNRSDLPHFAR